MVAADGALSPRNKLRLGDQPHFQAGAVGAPVFEGLKIVRIEFVALVAQGAVVPHPVGERIFPVRAGAVQDLFPQKFDGGVGALFGEDLLCPAHGGNGGDAPLVAVGHRVLIGL